MDEEDALALTPGVEAALLSGFPAGTGVIQAISYRPGYLPFPMRVQVQTPDGSVRHCVVKIGPADLIEREVATLRLLKPLELPVPEVLFEPIALPGEARSLAVISELPGRSLPWCGVTALEEADLACRLTLKGVARLHDLTEAVRRSEAATLLPQHTLAAEHQSILAEAGAWREVAIFQRAVAVVGEALTGITTPLVFSNGDYNPLNFLYEGQALCGFVDFEGACFENPHIGFAKFLIWSRDEFGWGTGNRAGLVERYLYTRNVSRRDFAPLLVLRCLRHLIREVSPKDREAQETREHMVQILQDGLRTIETA